MVNHGRRALARCLAVLLVLAGMVVLQPEPAPVSAASKTQVSQAAMVPQANVVQMQVMQVETGGYPYWDYNGPGSSPSGSLWTDSNGKRTSPYNYVYRNCTDFVAWKLVSLGVPLGHVNMLGDGGDWYLKAGDAYGEALPRGTVPAVGAAAVQPKSAKSKYGHVAYVTAVHANGTMTVLEYNWPINGIPDGAYHVRTGTPASMGFSHFVYFASLMTNPPEGGVPGAVDRTQRFTGVPPDGNVVENITPGAGGHYYVAAGGTLFWFNKNDPNLRTDFINQMKGRYGSDHPLFMTNDDIHALEVNYPTDAAHRPNSNTFLYERGSQTQFVVQYGYAFEITGSTGELAFLNGLGKATMVPVNSISPLFPNAGAMPDISPGRLLKAATSPDFYEVQAGYLYHANNMTVVDCLSKGFKVQNGVPSAYQPVPLTLIQAFLNNGRNAYQLATCQMPDDVVFYVGTDANRYQVTGNNTPAAPYVHRKYASTLAIHCYRGPGPTVLQMVTGGLDATQSGPDIHCPNNTYLKNNQTGQVFQWWDGQLHYISSPEMLSCLTQGNTGVVIPLPEAAFGGAPQGAPAQCQFEDKLLQAPNGQVFWVKDGARRYVGNAQILNCLTVRANAGVPVPVPVETVNSYTLGTNAYCTYPADIRFVRGDGQPEVWRVFPDGTRQHAGSLCSPQSDPRFAVHVVPAGEVDGHAHIGTFEATPGNCAAIS